MQYKLFFVGFMLLALQITAPVVAANFNDGVRAYQRADYAKALAIWKEQAENGNKVAQMLVGSMYAYGEGTSRDDKEAVKWFTLSAQSGYARAQFNLGVMYENGWGVTKDLNTAIYWFRQAASQGRQDARQRLEKYKTLAKKPAVQNEAHASRTAPGVKQATDTPPVDIASTATDKSNNTTSARQEIPVETTHADNKTVTKPAATPEPDATVTKPEKNGKERIALLIDTKPVIKQDSRPVKKAASATATTLPGDNDWLSRQNPDYYTIQLASNRSIKVLENFIETADIHNDYQVIVIRRDNNVSYALVYGAYSDINQAQDTIRRLPGTWRQYVPWIREIRSLHQE